MPEEVDKRLDEKMDKELDKLWKSIEESHAKFREEVERLFQKMAEELKAASECLDFPELNLGEGQEVEAQELRQKAGGHSQKSRKRRP